MLEIKKLTKIYHVKGGGDVRAIDDMSLTLGETGMVFLLGKSGSGKSTLLNLIGGLDRPDSGEIVIKGRGSSTFTSGDFDSYRNTFVGFIFQEYNVLEEFTVEDNIALALELQGKSKDRAKIDEILRLVELEGYGKRKPNTLSGGQKQRVAIARALVKDPEIIMADEPTGALDSETGRQVLDTLKKLSENKLVIVVSHDREFAENYGDRIIEIKDGRVISDVTRRAEGESSEVPEKAQYVATQVSDIHTKPYTAQDSVFIRSRLPMRHAIKIGLSSVRAKPIRLFFTILLSFIAFTMFGLFSTLMLFSERNTVAESLKMSADKSIVVGKSYNYTQTYYQNGEIRDDLAPFTNTAVAAFKEEERKDILENIDGDAVFVFDYQTGGLGDGTFSIENAANPNSGIYSTSLSGFGVVAEGSAYRADRILWGNYPQNTDEILISEYTYLSLRDAGYVLVDGKEVSVAGYDDLKNVRLLLTSKSRSVTGREYKVSGVYECDDVSAISSLSSEEAGQRVADGFYNYCLVADGFYADNSKYYGTSYINTGRYFDDIYDIRLSAANADSISISGAATLPPRSGLSALAIYNPDGGRVNSLSDRGVAINARVYSSLIYDAINSHIKSTYPDGEIIDPEFNADWQSAQTAFRAFDKGVTGEDKDVEFFSDEERMQKLAEVFAFADKYRIALLEDVALSNSGAVVPVQMEGIYFSDNYDGAYLGEQLFTRLQLKEGSYIKEDTNYNADGDMYKLFIVSKDGLDFDGVLDRVYSTAEDDSFCAIKNDCVTDIQYYAKLISILSDVFLCVGIAFAVFSMLLLFNFISVSIVNKKKEIGILRALGARGTDVFKIFYAESAFITLVCLVLSMVISAILCVVFNAMIVSELGVPLALFVFGPISVLIMAAIALFTSVISTFMPVYAIAKKRPADSIRAT